MAAAYYLLKHPSTQKIVILESSQRLGGWIRTTRTAKNGPYFEHGPRTIRPAGMSGANTLELLEELSLQDKVMPIKYGHPATLNRMVLVDGKLHKLPSSMKSLFRRQKPFGQPLFMAGIRDLLTGAKKCDDDSIYDFVARRFGQDVADYAIDPMVRGITAGSAKLISADAFVAGPLFRMEQEYGGVLKGVIASAFKRQSSSVDDDSKSELVKKARAEKWNVWSLENGLQTLVDKLGHHLESQGVEIRRHVNPLLIQSSKKADVVFNDFSLEADHILAATPAYATAHMLSQTTRTELVNLLSSIPYVTVAVVNVQYQGVQQDPAFGFLVPSSQKNVPILGAIYDTASFPQGDSTIFTVMMGGHWFEQLFGHNPSIETLKGVAVKQLENILGIKEKPVNVVGMIHRNCIAQYTVGHNERLKKARKIIAENKLPISLIGSSYDGVGVNDAIMSAKRHCQTLLSDK